jgi:hypothetical protein
MAIGKEGSMKNLISALTLGALWLFVSPDAAAREKVTPKQQMESVDKEFTPEQQQTIALLMEEGYAGCSGKGEKDIKGFRKKLKTIDPILVGKNVVFDKQWLLVGPMVWAYGCLW